MKERNKAVTFEERRMVALIINELMINVRLSQEIIIPLFKIKHGQCDAVALSQSGAPKFLKNFQEAYINYQKG